jgi:hypothetical protein
MDFCGKIFQASNDQPELGRQSGLISELLRLLFESCEALPEPGNAGFELLLVNKEV